MIGRKVKTIWGEPGEVIKWEPLQASMCDALVKFDTQNKQGHDECWYSSTDLRPLDGLGPLPSRREYREENRLRSLAQLKAIRAQHVRDFYKPWPGLEFGKAILGKSIDGAIAELEAN